MEHPQPNFLYHVLRLSRPDHLTHDPIHPREIYLHAPAFSIFVDTLPLVFSHIPDSPCCLSPQGRSPSQCAEVLPQWDNGLSAIIRKCIEYPPGLESYALSANTLLSDPVIRLLN